MYKLYILLYKITINFYILFKSHIFTYCILVRKKKGIIGIKYLYNFQTPVRLK